MNDSLYTKINSPEALNNLISALSEDDEWNPSDEVDKNKLREIAEKKRFEDLL